LADWLPEYFFKTANGTWRPPANAQEPEQKTALRQTGTLRPIKRSANALNDGVPVRDKDRQGSDIDRLDWLRWCRRAGLYEQGRAIYEGRLESHRLDRRAADRSRGRLSYLRPPWYRRRGQAEEAAV
jgi:hypothetical protein